MAGFFDRLRYGLRTPRQSAQPYREQGVAGFVIMGGMVSSNETNHRLNGAERWRTAADMLSNVSIIAAGLRYTLNLTARPKWKLDPVNDKAEAKAAAEFAQDIIENTDRSWSRIVRSTAMYRYHGFAINEWVASKRDDGKTGIQTVESRPQHTIEKWDLDPNGGVIGVVQRDPQTGQEIYLPRKKIVYLVDDEFTDRPDGMGVFRHLVEDWNQLKVYMKLERMGFQRDLVGLPVGRIPLADVNKMVQDGRITAEQRDQMIEGIRDFVSMETKSDTTGLLLDSSAYTAKSDTGETISSVMKWGIDLITGEQNSVEALGAAIKRTQFDMALAMGVSSLLTGREGEGSRALSEDQSRNLYLTVNQSLRDMAEAFDRDIIGPIWAMNGLKDDLRPKLTTEDAAFKDVEQIAATLQKMAAAGAILAPDDPAINDLRNLMGISEAEEMSVEDLALIRGAGKTPPEDKGGTGAGGGGVPSGPGGGKPGNDNKPKDSTTGAEQRRGKTQKSEPRTLYVQRKLLNADELIRWAKSNGFKTATPADDMHVTQCFSRAKVDWLQMGVAAPEVDVLPGGPRVVEPLGDKGAVVLLFRSPELESRHREMRLNGASWDYDSYQPHVTITYDGAGVDLSTVQPFQGELRFGPELFSEVVEDWQDSLVEKFNPNHKPAGPGGGQFTSGGDGGNPHNDAEIAHIQRERVRYEELRRLHNELATAEDDKGANFSNSAYARAAEHKLNLRPLSAAEIDARLGELDRSEANARQRIAEGTVYPMPEERANVLARIAAEGRDTSMKYNPHHRPGGDEHGGEFTSGSGGGGGKITIPRKFQPRNFAELKDHPAVEGIDDYRPDGLHVNLAPGFEWSEQRSFGVETVGHALRLMREVQWVGNGPPPWENPELVAKFDPNQPRDPAGTPTGGQWTSTGGGVIMVKDKLGNEAPVTEDSSLAAYLVKNPDGTYSLDPEREKLHEEIVKQYLAGVAPATGTPVMYMTGGGPASGKSAILVGGNQIPGQHDAVHVDPDAIKNQLPEYREMFAAGDPKAAGYAHEESSLVRRRLEAAARAGKYNVVLDTTGDSSVEKLAANINAYRNAGYRVNALYASLDTNLAVRLAHERGLKTGRFVPETFLRETHRNVTNTFMAAAQERHLFDSVKLYDTNENGNPRLVATGDRSSFTINDRKLWDDFVAKGKGP